VQVWILNFNFSLCYALRTEGSVTPIFRPSERKLQLNLVSRGSFFRDARYALAQRMVFV